MPDKIERKKAIREYKERDSVGGIYRYVNTKTNWKGIYRSTPNISGKESLLAFAKNTGLCREEELQAQWDEFGGLVFEVEVVDELKQKPGQDTKEFRKELKDMLTLYLAEI